MLTRLKLAIATLAAAVVFTAGLAVGRFVWKPKSSPTPTYQPEVIQKDGSRIVESKPQPKYKPESQVPKGSTVERVVTVSVMPVTVDNVARIEFVQVRLPDASTRVIAKSDGHILESIDIPVSPQVRPDDPKWAAGATYRLPSKTWGLFMQREQGRFLYGADLTQEREAISGISRLAFTARVGVRW